MTEFRRVAKSGGAWNRYDIPRRGGLVFQSLLMKWRAFLSIEGKLHPQDANDVRLCLGLRPDDGAARVINLEYIHTGEGFPANPGAWAGTWRLDQDRRIDDDHLRMAYAFNSRAWWRDDWDAWRPKAIGEGVEPAMGLI